MIKQTEKQLQDQVRTLALLNRWTVYHTHDSRRSDPGFPDLVLAKRGHPVIFAELKSPTGRVSPAQQAWLSTLRATPRDTGVQAYVWTLDNWDQIVEVLSGAVKEE